MAKAELQAILDCDNKPFIRAMEKAVAKQKAAGGAMKKSWGASMGAMWGVAKTPMLAVGVAAVAAGKSAFNAAGNIKDMSDMVSLSTDQFQKYSFALEQAGGSEEVLVKSMGQIIDTLQEAKTEGGKAAEQLAAIGVTADELKTIAPAEVFLRMSDALKESNGSTEGFAKVTDLVGLKIGMKLIPALKDGRKAFLDMGESATIMSAQSVNAVEGLGDKLNQMRKSLMAKLGNAMGAALGAVAEPAKAPEMNQTFVMDPVVVTPGRRPGFWQQDMPKFTKPTGNEEIFGPRLDGSSPFTGFSGGFFPGTSGGLTTGGLTTGGLTSGGGMSDAYGQIRRGDSARAKKAAKDAAGGGKAEDATAENTARLVEMWGGTGRRK